MTNRIGNPNLSNRILISRLIAKGVDRQSVINKLNQGLPVNIIYKEARDNLAFSGV